MKPTGFLAGLAVGLLGLVAFAVTSRSAAPAAVPLEQLHDAGWLQNELKLDAAQVKQVEALNANYAAAVAACCANHCSARKSLGAAVFTEGKDPVALSAMMEKMCKAQMESDLATVRHIQAVHAILRADQQTQYEKLVTNCVCADCPHCDQRGHKEAH
jgi:Spy/CpxP family protein refolding chaperone